MSSLSFAMGNLASSSVKEWFSGLLKDHARNHITSVLHQGIRTGFLEIVEGKSCTRLGNVSASEKPAASLTVLNDDFWLRVFFRHDLGFSEAYMLGDFESPDLKAVLDLWLDNREHLAYLPSVFSIIWQIFTGFYIWLFGQTFSNSKLSAVTGYDCSNDFFKSMLSDEMLYSCALWPENLGGVRGDVVDGPFPGDLEAAQQVKIKDVLSKARVKPGHRVLEFGSGWGAMSIAAAKMGCTVDSLTLSVEQKREADARIKAAGLEDRVTVHLMDYRNMPAHFEKAFDSFIAIEMVEAVGPRHFDQFWKILDWALKDKNAAAVITVTGQPEWRYTTWQQNDYAREYQWPNTFCPCATPFLNSAYQSLGGKFIVDGVDNYTHHYPRTLREWSRRFQKNWAQTVPALLNDQPHLREGNNLDIFRRKWEYMCIYAEVGYTRAYTLLMTYTFARPEYVFEKCD